MDKKPDVYWVQDSAGVNTCHVNDGSLNFVQSTIGKISHYNNTWHVILNDGTDITPDDCTLFRARACLESHYRKDKPVSNDRPSKAPRVAQAGKA